MTDHETNDYLRRVASKVERKQHARRARQCDVWSWIGLFGVIGWSVAIPTLAGVAAGIWLDARVESRISWTLTLLLLGVLVGCLTAWRWTREESGPEQDR